MAFSILNKRMLENDDIKSIVDKTKNFASILSFSQQQSFGIDFNLETKLTLKDYDSLQKKHFFYGYDILDRRYSISQNMFHDYGYILPIIRFEEIRDNSQIISEEEDTFTIQYGRGLTSSISDSDTLRKINMDQMMGNIIESNRKITIFLSKDGQKTQLRVFKNQKTGEEYVFMKKKDDETFDDSLDIQTTFVGIVSPLTWTVDKKTGLAICSNPLFLSERCRCEYDKSALAKFLESDEFLEELGVHQEKKQEKNRNVNNPFGDKKAKLNLEQKIKRLLDTGTIIPYLVGHPGVGKSQIAKGINKNCYTLMIQTFEPDKFTGKTSIIPGDKIITKEGDKTVEHNERGRTATAEPEWHIKVVEMSNKCRKSNERCVLFIDEFDKLTPNMQVYINGIVNNPRTIAGWEIPDNVDIILAGNTEEYSDAAFNISMEVASRLAKLEVIADTIEWLKWASKHDIDPIVKAYLYNYPNKIIKDVKNKDGDYDGFKSLTPRTWDRSISAVLRNARENREFPYLEPLMDEKSREEFEEFISMYFELGIEEILKGNIPTDTYDLTHDRIQTIINCLIVTASTEEEIINVLTFIRQNNLSEYQTLFEKGWRSINNSDEEIMKLRLAKNSLDERRAAYGK